MTPTIRQASDPAPAAAGIVPFGDISIPLSRPLDTHQGQVSVIKVRAPTVADYIQNGDVDEAVVLTDNGVPSGIVGRTDREALIRWTAALTGHDRVVLGRLGAADAGKLFDAVRQAVLPFSRGNSQSGSTSSSSSPDSTRDT